MAKRKNPSSQSGQGPESYIGRVPSIHELKDYIASCEEPPTSKEIARAFQIHSSKMKQLRNALKRIGDSARNDPKRGNRTPRYDDRFEREEAPRRESHKDSNREETKESRREETKESRRQVKPERFDHLEDKPTPKRTEPRREKSRDRTDRDRTKSPDKKQYDENSSLPSVTILLLTDTLDDGSFSAESVAWKARYSKESNPPKAPEITVPLSGIRSNIAPKVGDRVLSELKQLEGQNYSAGIIRILPNDSTAPTKMLGIFSSTQRGGIVEPVNRKDRHSYLIDTDKTGGANDGDLVEIERLSAKRATKHFGKVMNVLGDTSHPSAASMIAIHQHEIPTEFTEASVAQADASEPPVLENGRVDLREIPLITIDGADARDFDDAVFAEPDPDEKNAGGWHIVVAIADVSHYVRPNSPLDLEAKERGNSAYFPDRVVPMLPETLSNGLCSLNPDVDRYCMAVHIWLDNDGNTQRHQFVRGLMKSHGRWTYEKAQEAIDTGEAPEHLKHVYAAYDALSRHIDQRSPLSLDLPEFKAVLNDKGVVSAIERRERLTSHRLIEGYMIAANVAAGETLEANHQPAVYRVHEAPDMAKISVLKDLLKPSGYNINVGKNLHARMFNSLLKEAVERKEENIIHTAVLRSQMRAYYAEQNDGHFGLALESYTHFTSPIRRYSDLIVHRGLISALKLGEDGLTQEEIKELSATATHISETERRAMQAERTAMDRYMAAYMSDQVDAEFTAHVSGVTNVGLFLALDATGADGFIPKGTLADDFYMHDMKTQQLKGRKTGRVFKLGQPVTVILKEANPTTGSLRFVLKEFVNSPKHKRNDRRPHKGGSKSRKKRPS